MRSNTKLYAVALIFLVAAFAYGAVRLILMRYESGEVYPPYSTYRSDPLGAKVFYESLDALPGRIVTRNLDPLNTVAGNRAITLYINGLSIESYGPESLSGALARDIDRVLRHGGRVVLSFAPLAYDYDKELAEIEAFEERMDRRFNRDKIDDRDQPPRPEEPPPPPVVDDELPAESEKEDETVLSEPPTDQDESDDEEDREEPKISLPIEVETVEWNAHWDVRLAFDPLKHDGAGSYEPVIAEAKTGGAVPETLPVHTSLQFMPQSKEWNVRYGYDDKAVIMERPVGDGSLVLIADAYLFSNESLFNARNPELLAWTAGPHTEIVFDESLMGVQKTQGLTTLMWKYRMQGIFAALIVLAVLYIWKNGQPLAPPYEDNLPADAHAYTGKDSASGFVNLLRRSVPRDKVLRTCIAEFERSFSHRNSDFANTLRDAKAIAFREEQVEPKQRDITRAYREICQLFAKHRLR